MLRLLPLVCLYALLSGTLSIASQTPTTQSSEDTRRAAQALDQAVQALGGMESLQRINSISLAGKGAEFRSAEVQGRHPEKDTRTDHEERLAVNLAENKAAYEYRTPRHDGSVRWRKYIFSGDQQIFADFIAQQAAPRRSSTAERLSYQRRVPHLLLLEAVKHQDSLKSVSEIEFEGKKQQVISFMPTGATVPLKLFLDAETHLLSKFEYVLDFPALGETAVEFVYRGWRASKELQQFPVGHQIRVAGKVYQEVNYDQVTVNDQAINAAFTLPDELQSYLTAPGAITEITKGVFLVEGLGGFNPLFVEFKDYILAVEAPASHPGLDTVPPRYGASGDVSETLIKKIKERIPNKPIKYVAITHYHSDHAGGARAFLAEGTTILTTPGNEQFFQHLAAAHLSLNPDRLEKNPRAATIETITSKRVLTDGEQTVELISVGANPHTDEMLAVYLPKANFIYQGDLFYFSGDESFPTKGRVIIMQFFARWLRQQHLTPRRIYGFHGFGFATMEHVRRVMAWKD